MKSSTARAPALTRYLVGDTVRIVRPFEDEEAVYEGDIGTYKGRSKMGYAVVAFNSPVFRGRRLTTLVYFYHSSIEKHKDTT